MAGPEAKPSNLPPTLSMASTLDPGADADQHLADVDLQVLSMSITCLPISTNFWPHPAEFWPILTKLCVCPKGPDQEDGLGCAPEGVVEQRESRGKLASFRASSADLAPRAACMLREPQRKIRHVALCKLHCFSPESVPRVASLHKQQKPFLARMLTRSGKTCKTRRGTESWDRKACGLFWRSDRWQGPETGTDGRTECSRSIPKEAGLSLDAPLSTTSLHSPFFGSPPSLSRSHTQTKLWPTSPEMCSDTVAAGQARSPPLGDYF